MHGCLYVWPQMPASNEAKSMSGQVNGATRLPCPSVSNRMMLFVFFSFGALGVLDPILVQGCPGLHGSLFA